MKRCAVTICQNRLGKNRGDVSFHRFPVSETSRKAWLLSCGLDENFDCSQGRVCSIHFTEDDFERDLRGELLGQPLKKRLKQEVVPHLNVIQIKQEPIYIDDFEIEEESPAGDSPEASTSSTPDLDSSHFTNTVDPSDSFSTNIVPVLDSSHFTNTGDPSDSFSTDIVPVEPIVTTSVIFLPKNHVSSSMTHIPSSLPASQNWEGPYNFTVSFGPQEKSTKGVTWTYSSIKDKLYVGKDVPCPINFSANTTPDNVCIRVMALYGSPEHASEIVHRCVNHSMEELNKKIFEAEHLVRCESEMASYEIDQTTKRHSVVVPFDIPPVGQHYSTYIYKFACFGSCAGGPNRRPIMLIFTLEKDGKVVGRRRLDVKICACPGRDRKAEEQQLMPLAENAPSKKRKDSEMVRLADTLDFTKNIILPPTKKIKHSHNGPYMIKADDKEQYEFLIQMKTFYSMCKAVNSLPPDAMKALSYHHHKKHQDGDCS